MNSHYSNSSRPDPKDVLTEDDVKTKIAQIQENRERRKQGLPPSPKASEQQQEEKKEEGEPEETPEPPKISSPKQQQIPDAKNKYAQYQQNLQNFLVSFQADRFSEISQAARKEKHIIYKFEDKAEPPKLGEKKNNKQSLQPIDVYYNELPNDIHYELDAMRAKVADLQYIKSLQVPSTDQDGNLIPAVMTKNDPKRTDVSDKVFAHISEEIDKLNKKIAAKMALWYYGITEELLPQLENTSLSNALEAGLYREMYGIVNTSKNSAVY